MWPPRRPHFKCDYADYEHEDDTEQEPPRRRKKMRRRVNLSINTEAGVDGNASHDEKSDDENDDLDRFIVPDDIEF